MRYKHLKLAVGLLAALTLLSSGEVAVADYPKDYFQSPVGHKINLSGSFGELRPDHFHAGIDIKSATGQSGEPIFAAADGFVRRIKVEGGGYGNALYIEHPNGFTTVYAHLLDYNTDIGDFVRAQQYKNERFELDYTFPEAKIWVKKGQEIGKLGNTGSSGGPHLHFEIRDARTDETINPLLFGISVVDNIAPAMSALRVYGLTPERETTASQTVWLTKSAGNNYRVPKDTVTFDAWRVGFALRSFDSTNGNSNQNGLYRLKMYVDGEEAYKFEIDKFSFDDTRYINAHTDYEMEVKRDLSFNRCYLLPGNKLPLYTKTNRDVVELSREVARKITMVAEDIYGNASVLEFWVKQGPMTSETAAAPYHYQLQWNEPNAVKTGSLSLYFPVGSLYDDLNMSYHAIDDRSRDIYSTVHRIHENSEPIHKHVEIGIKPSGLPEELRNKAFVARCDAGDTVTNVGSDWQGDQIVGRMRRFGDYCVMIDTIKPTIVPRNFVPDMRKSTEMKFAIRDNVRSSGKNYGLKYRATVDGQFVLFQYDHKSETIWYKFDPHVSVGEHTFRLEVTDQLGNTSVFEKPFLR